MIMARTDAIATDGFQEALDRMALFQEIGVDLFFVEAPTDLNQLRQIPQEISGPCVVNLIDGGATPLLSAAECEDLGYAACAVPVAATHVVVKALETFYRDLLKSGDLRDAMQHGVGFQAYTDLVGFLSNGRPSKPTWTKHCLLYTSPSPRDKRQSRMPSSA